VASLDAVPLSPIPLSSAPLESVPASISPVDVAAATAKLASLGSAPLTGLGSMLEPPVVPAAPAVPGAPAVPDKEQSTVLQPGSVIVASLDAVPLSPIPLSSAPLESVPTSISTVDVAAATAKLASLGSAPLTGLGSTLEPPAVPDTPAVPGAPAVPDKEQATIPQPGSILVASLESAPLSPLPLSPAAMEPIPIGNTASNPSAPDVVLNRLEEPRTQANIQVASAERRPLFEPVRHLVGPGGRPDEKVESAPAPAYFVRFGGSKMLAKQQSDTPIEQIRAVRLLTSDLTSATATPGNVSAYVLGQLLARQSNGVGVGSTAAAALGQLLSTQLDTTNATTANKQVGISSGGTSDTIDVRGRLIGAAPIDSMNPQSKGATAHIERDIESEGKSVDHTPGTRKASGDEITWESEETRKIHDDKGELIVSGKRPGGKAGSGLDAEEDERIDEIEEKGRGFGGGGSSTKSQTSNNDPTGASGQQSSNTDPDQKNTGTTKGNQAQSNDDLDSGQLSELVRELRGRPTGTTTTRRPIRTEPQGLRFEKRRRYKIRLADTLESIARRELGNVKAAPLILRINRPTVMSNDGAIVLKPGIYIILPSHGECLRHLAEQALSEEAKLVLYVDPTSSSGAPTYVCRFGETLISIATRHEQLGDIRFWALLARVNNLSENTDRAGEPISKLRRGQRLLLPTKDQKAIFLRQLTQQIQDALSNDDAPVYVQPPGGHTTAPSSAHREPSPAVQPHPERGEHDAGIAPPDGHTAGSSAPYKQPNPDGQPHTKPVDRPVVSPQTVRTVASNQQGRSGEESNTQPAGTSDVSKSKRASSNQPSVYVRPPKKPDAQANSVHLPPLPLDTALATKNYETRVVSQGDLGDTNDNLKLALELRIGDTWTPVVQYRVRECQSSVSAYTSSGRQRTLTIDLPNRAARELAENDLTANASSYCQRYLANQLPF
ncbi:MAG TPA: hypothetical protein V6D22_22260, partial [Candidatus Obscuribacterales bacterium]